MLIRPFFAIVLMSISGLHVLAAAIKSQSTISIESSTAPNALGESPSSKAVDDASVPLNAQARRPERNARAGESYRYYDWGIVPDDDDDDDNGSELESLYEAGSVPSDYERDTAYSLLSGFGPLLKLCLVLSLVIGMLKIWRRGSRERNPVSRFGTFQRLIAEREFYVTKE